MHKHVGAVTFVLTAIFMVSLCYFCPPIWWSMDDPLMSMMAHGYGAFVKGSPLLWVQNPLWGYLIRAVPPIGGVPGYSTVFLLSLFAIFWALMYFVKRLGFNWITMLLLVCGYMWWPLLHPQFTVNAGLFAIAAVLGVQLYNRTREPWLLVISGLLFFCGFLIRWRAPCLILLIALPCLPWQLFKDVVARRAAVVMCVCLLAATLVAHLAYRGSVDWGKFAEVSAQTGRVADERSDYLLFDHPKILEKHAYSANDLQMLSHWILIDPVIYDPKVIKSMLTDLGPLPTHLESVDIAMTSVMAFFLPACTLLFACLAYLLGTERRRFMASLLISLLAVAWLGLTGRFSAIWHVYICVVYALLFVPLFYFEISRKNLLIFNCLIVLSVSVFSSRMLLSFALEDYTISRIYQREVSLIPRDEYVVMWNAFPFKYIYPMLADLRRIPELKIYSMAWNPLMPGSVSLRSIRAGDSMLDRLRSKKGVLFLTKVPANLVGDWIRTYCQEHWHSEMREAYEVFASEFQIKRVWCTDRTKI